MSNRDLFGNVVTPSITVGSKKWYSVPLTALAHVVGLGPMIIAPLMATDALPDIRAVVEFVPVVSAPPPPPPGPPPRTLDRIEPQTATRANPDAAPLQTPSHITAEPSTTFDHTVEDGLVTGLVTGIGDGLLDSSAPPPPPPPPDKPVVVGGNIQRPLKVKHVNPLYPPIAQAARVQGIVIIEAIIGPQGRVQDAKVLRSIALLDAAALEAVRQWEFTPTLLNGAPVTVVMTVTVNFTLQ